MAKNRRELGFGTVAQTANLFGVTRDEALRRATCGDWPSWIIGGRRIFDLDEIAQKRVESTHRQKAAS